MTSKTTAGPEESRAGRAPRTLLELIVNQTDPTDRITVTGQSVTLDVTGQPDVENKYGSGQIRPRIVRLSYQDTAIHAQVYGCWVREDGELTDDPIDQDYVARTGDVRDWPDWLAAAAYLAKGAAASAVVAPPTDRAVCDCEAEVHMGVGFYHQPQCATRRPAVLPEPTDRSGVLYEAADHFDRMGRTVLAASQVRDELHRLAVEAHGTGTQQQVPQRAYPDCERCGDTGVDPEWDGAEPCPECQQTSVPAPVAQQPAAEESGPWVVQKICCGRDDGTAEFATWEAADSFRETYIDSSRVAGHERTAIIRRKDAPAAEQQAAAADGEETRARCAHTDIVYGRCVLPIPHDGECVHERQPRCAMPSPDRQHSCVLPPNHEWLHADKHLAEVMPNGSRAVWETPTEAPPSV